MSVEIGIKGRAHEVVTAQNTAQNDGGSVDQRAQTKHGKNFFLLRIQPL